MLQGDVQRGRTGRDDHVVGEGMQGVANPLHPLTVCRDLDAGQLRDGADGAVVARQPFGEEQRHRARLGDRDRFLHGKDVLGQIGGVDVQGDDAGIGDVTRVRNRRQGRGQGGRRGRGLLRQGGRGGREEQKSEAERGGAQARTDHRGLFRRLGEPRQSDAGGGASSVSADPKLHCTPKTRAKCKDVQLGSVLLHRTQGRRGGQIVLPFRVVGHAPVVAHGMVVDLGDGLQILVQPGPAPRLDQLAVDHRP